MTEVSGITQPAAIHSLGTPYHRERQGGNPNSAWKPAFPAKTRILGHYRAGDIFGLQLMA
jgi:hypothetical protein